MAQTGTNYYFGSKLIKNAGGYVVADRLGSIGKFYPWGQEKPSATTNGTEKFTGYFRDAETGLDYADQRYHNPGTGRFMTSDPYVASGGPADPGSWNRYAYTRGDPVNRIDRTGLDDCSAYKDAYACPYTLDSGGGGGDTCTLDPVTFEELCPSGDSCYGDDFFSSSACQTGGPGPGPGPAPAQPTCSITEYSRATPRQFGVAQHTYLVISDPEILSAPEALESGPSQKPKFFNPWGNWGSMVGYDPTVSGGAFTDPLGTTNISSSNLVASDTGGQGVCDDIAALIEAFNNYKSGSGVPYKPIPRKGSGNYNSNSFTFTLLYDVGLVNNGPFSVFPSPPGFGWTPGWGMLVPGLHP